MSVAWYFRRLMKMSPVEVWKRVREQGYTAWSRIRYRNSAEWPYGRFAGNHRLILRAMPRPTGEGIADPKAFRIYNRDFDLTREIDWHASGTGSRWPVCHHSRIRYRPGNPHGDIRIAWEINRLQFLPHLAVLDEPLSKKILADWLEKNPFPCGQAYVSSMEAALRWISIYWAVCLFREPPDPILEKEITGLGIASGEFIARHLSTHSSAGNHLVIEAVGLFWIGKAFEREKAGAEWVGKAGEILRREIGRQINPDGTGAEQTFWYLGFVLDGLCHYLLLEEKMVPAEFRERIGKAFDFVNDMTEADGSFPDFGDRDDGYVFRTSDSYGESPFNGLLAVGSRCLGRPEWARKTAEASRRAALWSGCGGAGTGEVLPGPPEREEARSVRVYEDGGMVNMRWGGGRVLFRCSVLGLAPTFGHGHADALSVLFWWKNNPVLIDAGSGQYNGEARVRDYFRSTIAHNTVEIGQSSQAGMLGPFLWDGSYGTVLKRIEVEEGIQVEGAHDGYRKRFATTHKRRLKWHAPGRLEIEDMFPGPGGISMRGAFHLDRCSGLTVDGNTVWAEFATFGVTISLPEGADVRHYRGSEDPFMGWKTGVYGKWEPMDSIVYSLRLRENHAYTIILSVRERGVWREG